MENFTYEELSMIASTFNNKAICAIGDKRRKGIAIEDDKYCQLLITIFEKARRAAWELSHQE